MRVAIETPALAIAVSFEELVESTTVRELACVFKKFMQYEETCANDSISSAVS
jgi:hypothetical protein